MNDESKKYLLIGIVVVAVIVAGYSIFKSTAGEPEQVVGTLPMASGGGRDAEKGAAPAATGDPSAAADPSGMPASVLQNGK
jgi:hypothetical protein